MADVEPPDYDKLTRLKLFGMARVFANQSALDQPTSDLTNGLACWSNTK